VSTIASLIELGRQLTSLNNVGHKRKDSSGNVFYFAGVEMWLAEWFSNLRMAM
jgi:hypothetical protein